MPKNKNPFKAATISQLLIKFSAPAVAGLIVNALHNIISRMFIGNDCGALGIAGVTVTFPIGFVFIAFSALIGIGANALFSIRLGEHRKDEAALILGNAFSALVLVSAACIGAVYTFAVPVLKVSGATPAIMPYAKEYLLWILPGYFIYMISAGMNNFIRSSGRPKTAMATQIIGACVNFVCAPLFIHVLQMGMKGAGLAVVAGQAVSSAWVMLFFLRPRAPYPLLLQNLRLKAYIVKDSIAVGSAQFLFQLAAAAVTVILNQALVKYGGDIAVSAVGIVISVNMIFTMPIMGLAQGAQPLIGYNHGARKYSTSIQTLKMAIRWGTAFAVLAFIFMQAFARPLVMLFNKNDAGLINMAIHALRIINLGMPLVALPYLAASFFQAVKMPVKAAIISMSRQFLMLIPLVMILPLFWGLEGVFYAPPLADLMCALLGAYMLRRHFTKHKQNFFFSKKF